MNKILWIKIRFLQIVCFKKIFFTLESFYIKMMFQSPT